jgi:hypothetical protein
MQCRNILANGLRCRCHAPANHAFCHLHAPQPSVPTLGNGEAPLPDIRDLRRQLLSAIDGVSCALACDPNPTNIYHANLDRATANLERCNAEVGATLCLMSLRRTVKKEIARSSPQAGV